MNKDINAILGRVTSGIYILTAGVAGRATGMLTSWVMQAGFEPPMITVGVKQGRYVGEWITRGEPFNLNVVGDGQKDLVKHFARGFEPGESAFEGLEIRRCARGVPILSSALGHLECELASHVDSGDHRVFLARVVRGGVLNDQPPMVHIRKSGANY
jgi:flavin reductase (DIM6/NTAB) family NADH-FMN oxidoreductase RutF